jgi:hypothetical protein
LAKFRRVECSIWENDDFIGLPAGAQDQFFYILTNPARTESGLYRLSKTTMFWRTNTNKTHFARLVDSALLEWDDDNGLVWITSAMDPRYFKPNPNIIKSVIADLQTYWPHTFAKQIGERYSCTYKEIARALQTLRKG